MAQVISTQKTSPINYGSEKKNSTKKPLFSTFNYILMGVGVLFLAIGYITLSGGASKDPNQFNEDIFNTQRLVVAPLLMLCGLVIEIVAIMYYPQRKKKISDENTDENTQA